MLQDFATSFSVVFKAIGMVFSLALYWAPVILGIAFWEMWKEYVRMEAMAKTKWILLGLRLPNNILKTPLSMELVLTSIHQPSAGNWYDRYWNGKFMPWFSLELASIGGDIHFYIRTQDRFKNFLEAQIYSQFPGVEIFEAEDYTNEIEAYVPGGEWEMWATEFKLTKPDPYPIKTYIDYKLDQAVKKEEELSSRTDPITTTIEFLGSIGKNERIWTQILVQATHKRFNDPKTWFGKRDWKGEAKDLLSKMQAKAGEGKLSKSDSEAMSAIEREISKAGFDCGIRAIYLGKDGAFSPLNIPGVVGMFKHYNSESLNGFKPNKTTSVDFPWQEWLWNKDKVAKMKKKMLRAYRARGYFYPPFKRKPFVLNTEELATIYHFPGGMQATPGFVTISSRKAEPPSNLPI